MVLTFSDCTLGLQVPIWVHWYLASRWSGESILAWWEKRRAACNAILFLWGAWQFGLLGLIHLLQLGYQRYRKPIDVGVMDFLDKTAWMLTIGPILQITANVWYTGGWVVEWIALRLFGWKSLTVAPHALLAGTLFSLVFAELFYLLTIALCLDDLIMQRRQTRR